MIIEKILHSLETVGDFELQREREREREREIITIRTPQTQTETETKQTKTKDQPDLLFLDRLYPIKFSNFLDKLPWSFVEI